MRQDEGYKVKKAPITAPWFLAPYPPYCRNVDCSTLCSHHALVGASDGSLTNMLVIRQS